MRPRKTLSPPPGAPRRKPSAAWNSAAEMRKSPCAAAAAALAAPPAPASISSLMDTKVFHRLLTSAAVKLVTSTNRWIVAGFGPPPALPPLLPIGGGAGARRERKGLRPIECLALQYIAQFCLRKK